MTTFEKCEGKFDDAKWRKTGGFTMAKYAIINQETCIGCGNCEGIAPDIFTLDEEGIAFVKLDRNQGSVPIQEDKLDDLEEAIEDCPTDSVMVANQPFDK